MPDARVEQECDDRAFDVVADGSGVRVDAGRAVVPHAGRRLLERLREPSRRLLQLVDPRSNRAEELIRRAQPAAREHQRGVVLGEAFRLPEARRAWRVVVVERPQLDRPQPLRVEGVEVLVADEAEPAMVTVRRDGAGRVRRQQRRGPVLETAAPAARPLTVPPAFPITFHCLFVGCDGRCIKSGAPRSG